jgi:hypothetical protein
MFEDSLTRLADTDKYADEVLLDWRKTLAEHVRETFERHTEKLISNTKNLKAYENGRKYIKNAINKNLIPKKVKHD